MCFPPRCGGVSASLSLENLKLEGFGWEHWKWWLYLSIILVCIALGKNTFNVWGLNAGNSDAVSMRFLPYWDAVPCALCITPIESDTQHFQDAGRTINKLHWIELHEPCSRKMDCLWPCQPPSRGRNLGGTLTLQFAPQRGQIQCWNRMKYQRGREIMLVWVNPDKNQGNSELRPWNCYSGVYVSVCRETVSPRWSPRDAGE